MSPCPNIVFRSARIGDLLARLAKVARTDAEILLIGESGVGKELFAEYAHARSPRADKPFVTLNCANLASDLFENELFGHVRGAFTGAQADAQGLVGLAEGGTLFLDELDALPLATQAKMLRFVQHKEYRRLGESHLRHCNARIIAATNSDLDAKVREGSFREDLLFRLRVMSIEVPPLRERPDDIEPLIAHFAERYAAEYGVAPVAFSARARARLLSYPWPGNVRELENCIRSLSCLALGRDAEPADLQLLSAGRAEPAAEAAAAEDGLLDLPLKEAKSGVVQVFEQAYVSNALERTEGNVSRAARESGKHRRAFFELMRKYGLRACDFRCPSRRGASRQTNAGR